MNKYFEALGINRANGKPDLDKLEKALLIAHDIRKFEIDLYWRRSAYMWALQAVAFAGFASVFKGITADCGNGCDPLIGQTTTQVSLIFSIAIWCFGTFSAFIWTLILAGAKTWQNNWERHVDFLEDEITGPLYKIYAVKTNESPYSVTKLNSLLAGFMLVLWLVLGLTLGIVVFDVDWFVLALPFLVVCLPLIWLFDPELRMSNPGKMTPIRTKLNPNEYHIRTRQKPIIRSDKP